MTQVSGKSHVQHVSRTEHAQSTGKASGTGALHNARGHFDARHTLGVSSGALRNVSGGAGHAATVLAQSTVHTKPSHGPVA